MTVKHIEPITYKEMDREQDVRRKGNVKGNTATEKKEMEERGGF